MKIIHVLYSYILVCSVPLPFVVTLLCSQIYLSHIYCLVGIT